MNNVPGKWKTLGLLAMVMVAPASLALAQQPPAPPPQPAAEHVLDRPINWLKEAKHNYDKVVQNYTCTLIKRERINGVMQEPNIIMFSARVHPFSVYMKWIGPEKARGREVCYVQGAHNDNMRVHEPGPVKGLVWVTISPDDERTKKHSRHSIRDAGLGKMIERNLETLLNARNGAVRVNVRIADFKFDKRVCIRVETKNEERLPGMYCYRSVLYLEKESKIPMRLENYDWPTAANPEGELIEEFSYANLNFNVPMRDDLFNK